MELKHRAFEPTIPTEPPPLERRRRGFASRSPRLRLRRSRNSLGVLAAHLEREVIGCGSLMGLGFKNGERDLIAVYGVGLELIGCWGLAGGG